jgi:D-alanyl-D-alanine-carboxypeptidase/D-alanyl-D-alanine-endopeptidase
MPPTLAILLVALSVVLFSTRELGAQNESPSWKSVEVEAILKQRIDVDKRNLALIVGIVDASGRQIISHGSLQKSVNPPKPDGETVFEIGSVSKVFTSLLLADMVIRGEVALSDTASKYLPTSVTMPKSNGREITLLDLATHQSGLPGMPDNFAPADHLNPYADYTVDQMYDFLSKCKLTREIGAKFEYSNLGAGLLGHILALRAGTDFETLIATRISRPLGMTSTAIALTTDMKSRLATGHDESLSQVKNWDIPTLAGAGAIRSTMNDMLKFVEANLGKEKSTLEAAMLIQHETRGETGSPNLSIALGWHKLKVFGSDVIWHNGETGGYHSFVGFDKRKGVGVVVLTNTATDIDDIGLHILDRRIPLKKMKQKKERKAIQVDAKMLQSYVGDYEIVPAFVISITQEADQLMLQATGQQKLELFAESEKKFFLKAVDAQITFVSDDKGRVTQLILHQGGANQPAKRRAP